MNIPSWIIYLGAVVCFWIGYGTAAILFVSERRAINAKILGELGPATEGKHGEGVLQGPDSESQAVTVQALLSEKKARTRKVKTTANGAKATHVE